MKILSAFPFIAVLLAGGLSAEPALKPGMPVDFQAISTADWIQGERPASFEPGKIYVFECWATWCCGCIAHIPRLNEIHHKFQDKGLLVYGIDVWEDDKEKVAKFVRAKGDGMSYPVAFTGRGSAFDVNWLKAIGQRSIPHTFVVKDGKLVLACSPHYLTDEVITGLLDPASFEKTVETIAKQATPQDGFANSRYDFESAQKARNIPAMEAALAECEKYKASESDVIPLRINLCFAKRDWPKALKHLEDMPTGMARNKQVRSIAIRAACQPAASFPPEFTMDFARILSAAMQDSGYEAKADDYAYLTVIQWRNNAREEAAASALRAAESAKKEAGKPESIAAFEKFSTSLSEANPPDIGQLRSWEKGGN